jgi:hypothetical protein
MPKQRKTMSLKSERFKIEEKKVNEFDYSTKRKVSKYQDFNDIVEIKY